jgi:AraC-like DNA-binding protein
MGQGKLFFWDARALYVGRTFGLRPHRNAVAVLCVALDAACYLARDARKNDAENIAFRTALIPPNTLHHLRVPGNQRMAFLYVDGLSDDYSNLLAAMLEPSERVAIRHTDERAWLDTLTRLAGGANWRHCSEELTALLGSSPSPQRDPRIEQTLMKQRMAPSQLHSLAQAADDARLSQSRFLHLFKSETGLPYRRYRLWMRIGAALATVRAGGTLTEAAHSAGFSSSSHFTSAFTGMFGMAPSKLTHLIRAK